MKKGVFGKILSHLKNKDLITEDFPTTEDALMEILYSDTEERKIILRALISLFSEDYKSELQKGISIESDLANKFAALGLVTENRLNFVLGKCKKAEQQAVYDRLFKALHFALTAQEHDQEDFPMSLLLEDLPKKENEPIFKSLKKCTTKCIDIEQGYQLLSTAQAAVENASQFIDLKEELRPQAHKTAPVLLEDQDDNESMYLELSNTLKSLKLQMKEKHIISSPSGCAETSSVGSHSGYVITELHSNLQFLADCIKSPASEKLENHDIDKKVCALLKHREVNSIVKDFL